MFRLLINRNTDQCAMYGGAAVPDGVIPNINRPAERSVDGSYHAKINDYVEESNVVCTNVGNFSIDKFENGRVYFNTDESIANDDVAITVYGQKVPETHDFIILPEEFNDAPETASHERNDDGTYTFTENAAAVAGRARWLLNDAISERTKILNETDWTQMPDSPLTDEKKATWAVYRQALRDFPNTYTGDPDNWRSAFPSPPV